MNLLITQAEIEALPEDPRQRFVGIEEICRKRLYEETGSEQDWSIIQDARLRYMSTVVAAAKYYKIEPISEVELSKKTSWKDDEFNDFVAELQFYTMQLMLESAEKNSRLSILLEGSTRDRLFTLVSHLRDHVRKLDGPEARIDRLVRVIDDFEKELRRPRLQYIAVAALSMVIISSVADLGGAATTITGLVHKVQETVGLAKEEQNKEAASRMLPQAEVKKLAPPRTETFGRSAPKPKAPAYSSDLDDDIPF